MDDPLAVDVLGNLREYGALGQRHEDAIISGITDASWIDDATAALVDLLSDEARPAKLFRDNLLLFLEEGGDATAAADVRFFARAKVLDKLQRSNQQQRALREATALYREYVDACGSGIGQHMRTRSTHAVWEDALRRVRAERALAGGVSPWDALRRCAVEAEQAIATVTLSPAAPR